MCLLPWLCNEKVGLAVLHIVSFPSSSNWFRTKLQVRATTKTSLILNVIVFLYTDFGLQAEESLVTILHLGISRLMSFIDFGLLPRTLCNHTLVRNWTSKLNPIFLSLFASPSYLSLLIWWLLLCPSYSNKALLLLSHISTIFPLFLSSSLIHSSYSFFLFCLLLHLFFFFFLLPLCGITFMPQLGDSAPLFVTWFLINIHVSSFLQAPSVHFVTQSFSCPVLAHKKLLFIYLRSFCPPS